MSTKYTVMLAVCLATGLPCTANAVEADANPVETSAVPAGAAADPTGSATVPAEAGAPPAEAAAIGEEATAVQAEVKEPLMEFAPITYTLGGNVGYVMQRQVVGDNRYNSQQLNANANVIADSFIWQPWLAKLNGNLGLNANKISNSGTTSSSSFNNYLTGRGMLSLVPRSNFPFETYVERSDSRQSSSLGPASGDYQATRYGFTQQYHTLSGAASYLVGYDHNLWKGSSMDDKQDVWRFDTSNRITDHQSLRVYGTSNKSERAPSGDRSRFINLVATHNYRADEFLTVDTLASRNSTDYIYTPTSSSSPTNTGSDIKQFSSSTFWRSNEKPLLVTGGVRMYEMGTKDSTTVTPPTSRNVNINLGANYDVTKHTRVNGGANVDQITSNGLRYVTSRENAGASYIPDIINLGDYNYTRSVSGSVGNQNGGPAGNTRQYVLSPGHGVNRNQGLNGGLLTTSLNQSLSFERNSGSPTTSRLIHVGSMGWTIREDQKTTMLRMNLSDSHSQNGSRDYFQLLNMQASISDNVSRNASLGGNLTYQKSRQSTGGSAPYLSTNSSADMNYRHNQAFGVPRLAFISELRIYSSEIRPPQAVTVGVQDSNSWENRFEHYIGMLQTRLSFRIADVNHVRQSLLFFSVNRQF